ncbi:DUF983 domain-containing protein [Hyphococcus luteus]|uniref:DUF983 domain-containing protein n=1 Tax=Hyphococcus luteus TaxID=2058213 RepID=A0A2S7K622_9PROT|nr:DUF983 domain-containing protein [Marinicaulis flavus]PQA87926.1 hypothetical protein CW354_06165 [Marinicaulis flavus]
MTYYPPVSPYAAGLGAKCPRCGQGKLFEGFLKLKPACEVCGLDYAKADSGDGPAVFVIFIVGFIAVALAFVARYVWYAPMGVALFLSIGFAIVSILALLRPLKATMIALQYAHKAQEGRLEE